MDGVQAIYQNYRAIEHDLETLLRYVDLSKCNYSVNSAEIRKIILASCAMIESCAPLIKDNIQSKGALPKQINAKFINKLTKDNGIDLENLQPLICSEKFNPWEHPFLWWEAYNTIKHSERSQDNIKFFKAAIDSVLALFVLVVLLTRHTTISLFWHEHDLVKISEKGSNKPINYAAQTSLEKILGWNKSDA